MQRPERARFLLQLEASPYAVALHNEDDDVAEVWSSLTDDLGKGLEAGLVNVPAEVLYDLALGPAVRLAASADTTPAGEAALHAVARACWRAITP